MAEDALQIVQLRNNFYRDNYRKVVVILLLLIISNVILAGGVYYLFTHRPKPDYFATSPDGRITKLYPLSAPVISTSALLSWVTQAAVASYTYNFVDYRKQLQDASAFFTPDGWRNFEDALVKSRNLETVIAKKLVVTAVPTGAPVIVDRRVINGRFAWKVSMPVLVKYQSSSTSYQQALVLTIIVTRVPVLSDPKGIAISQFIAQ